MQSARNCSGGARNRVQPERITWVTIIGWLLLGALLAAVATPIALWVGPAGQPVVIRLAVAVLGAVIVARLVQMIRQAAMLDQLSPAETATTQTGVPAPTDPVLTELARELRWRHLYRWITPALWERLQHHCRLRGVTAAISAGERPSWQEAERIVRSLEQAP